MQKTGTEFDVWVYTGACLIVFSAALGVIFAWIYVLRNNVQTFRYGVFYSVFALVASLGFCAAGIVFYFEFLVIDIAYYCTIFNLVVIAAILAMAMFVRKDSRVLFFVLSFYSAVVIWISPLFLWNIIYLCLDRRKTRSVEHGTSTTPRINPWLASDDECF
jgi:hypothetical protein